MKTAATKLEGMQAWADSAKALSMLGRAFGLHGLHQEAQAALEKAEALYERAHDLPGVMQVRLQRSL